jgi:hypothetical protein
MIEPRVKYASQIPPRFSFERGAQFSASYFLS